MKKCVILVLMIFLVSCGSQQGDQPQVQEFRSGTQGLTINFGLNLPPSRLFDTEAFHTLIEVENQGAFDVGGPGDKVYLSGFDPTIIQGINSNGEQIPRIEGKSQFVPQGEFDTISFEGRLRPLHDRQIDKYSTTILATGCYNYETVATANVCLDPDPYSRTKIGRASCRERV